MSTLRIIWTVYSKQSPLPMCRAWSNELSRYVSWLWSMNSRPRLGCASSSCMLMWRKRTRVIIHKEANSSSDVPRVWSNELSPCVVDVGKMNSCRMYFSLCRCCIKTPHLYGCANSSSSCRGLIGTIYLSYSMCVAVAWNELLVRCDVNGAKYMC